MQRIAVALALCSLALFVGPRDANAGPTLNLGLDLGLNVALEEGIDAGYGLGVNPGIEVIDGLAIEINTGFDRFAKNGLRTRLIPFQLGVRYRAELGSVTPFGFLHFGPVNINVKVQGLGLLGLAASASDTRLGLNAGGGVEFALADNTGVGAQVGVSNVFTEGESFTHVNFAVVTHFSF